AGDGAETFVESHLNHDPFCGPDAMTNRMAPTTNVESDGRPEPRRRGDCALREVRASPNRYSGCGTILMYGFGAFHPDGYFSFASASETEPAMITSSPCFQFTGVATLCFAVSWSESITRRTSSKFRPVVIG